MYFLFPLGIKKITTETRRKDLRKKLLLKILAVLKVRRNHLWNASARLAKQKPGWRERCTIEHETGVMRLQTGQQTTQRDKRLGVHPEDATSVWY